MKLKTKIVVGTFWYSLGYMLLTFLGLLWYRTPLAALIFMIGLSLMGVTYAYLLWYVLPRLQMKKEMEAKKDEKNI